MCHLVMGLARSSCQPWPPGDSALRESHTNLTEYNNALKGYSHVAVYAMNVWGAERGVPLPPSLFLPQRTDRWPHMHGFPFTSIVPSRAKLGCSQNSHYSEWRECCMHGHLSVLCVHGSGRGGDPCYQDRWGSHLYQICIAYSVDRS